MGGGSRVTSSTISLRVAVSPNTHASLILIKLICVPVVRIGQWTFVYFLSRKKASVRSMRDRWSYRFQLIEYFEYQLLLLPIDSTPLKQWLLTRFVSWIAKTHSLEIWYSFAPPKNLSPSSMPCLTSWSDSWKLVIDRWPSREKVCSCRHETWIRALLKCKLLAIKGVVITKRGGCNLELLQRWRRNQTSNLPK